MTVLNLTAILADVGAGGQDPGSGIGIGLIVAAVVAIVLAAALLTFIFKRGERASRRHLRRDNMRRGGGKGHPSSPPFESISPPR